MISDIILKPIITEKMTQLAEKKGQYGFIVAKNATKYQIKNAIEKIYDVKVDSVNTYNYVGKVKMRSTKKGISVGRVNRAKKAIVSLKEGYKIDVFANI
jgi:large subunit ribosomal protein L23